MEHVEILKTIINETPHLVYISDIDTHELHYVNKSFITQLGYDDSLDWKNKKCYELIQHRTSPCEHCTNATLSEDEFNVWQLHHESTGRYFKVKDKLIKINNKLMRLNISENITKRVYAEQEIKAQLEEQSAINTSIEILHTPTNIHESINKLLKIITGYYDADRAYLFYLIEDGKFLQNRYEWCKEGVKPQINKLQRVPASLLQYWFNRFDESGEFYISDIKNEIPKTSAEYDIFDKLDINSLIVAPLKTLKGEYLGFIGVDHPNRNKCNTNLMSSVAIFINSFINRNTLINKLNKLSYYDELTGIKNRNSYKEQITRLEKKELSSLGILYTDIRSLKEVNENESIKAGDFLIKRLAEILSSIFLNNVYRIGGDEFIVLHKNISKKTFHKKVEEVFKLIAEEEKLNVDMGYLWNDNIESILKDIEKADSLMYMNKQENKQAESKYYTTFMHTLTKELEEGCFHVFLQPQIDLKTKKTIGAEALVRKKDMNGKFLPPQHFVPFYEQEGVIALIDIFVFEKVCKTLKKWFDRGVSQNIQIATNFSRKSIFHENLSEILLEICKAYKVKPDNIIIELTETLEEENRELLAEITTKLSNFGFNIALDDFGVGHSNLSTLLNSNFDEIKIDRSLISNIITDTKSKKLTSLIISLCETLEKTYSLAEGIETTEQCELLTQMNCIKGQGYLFGKPMPIEEFEKNHLFLS